MRFNSLVYPLFLALVVIVLRFLPARFRAAWLLAASYAFYASWHWPYVFLLFGCVALNHFGAVWIAQGENRSRRGAFVVAADVALLALFKYLDWLIGTVDTAASWFGFPVYFEPPRWVLPLGISFYVFESISYVVDVIRKRERIHSFWDFQLFIAFFPKLIAGPILRAKELLPQIEKPTASESAQFTAGIVQIVLGMFIKIVLADGLAADVDRAFARNADALGAADVGVMAVAFGLQIYFDFSGYSRIAIGSALLCGIRLVDNFDYPYTAASPVDFWNRWHMSLSRWIRDYLFYPLLRRQTSRAAMVRAAILSMTLCGLWHGAGWPFVVWGFYHGLLIAGYHMLRREGASPQQAGWLRRGVALVVTFVLVQLGWLWFRSQNIEQALSLWRRLATPGGSELRLLSGTFYLQVALLTAGVWLAPAAARLRDGIVKRLEARSAAARYVWAGAEGIVVGLLAALSLVYLRGQSSFIYFQF